MVRARRQNIIFGLVAAICGNCSASQFVYPNDMGPDMGRRRGKTSLMETCFLDLESSRKKHVGDMLYGDTCRKTHVSGCSENRSIFELVMCRCPGSHVEVGGVAPYE